MYPLAMDITTISCVLGVSSIFLYFIWRILNWLWFKPKKIEKFLKDQGLKGTPYKFLYGDLKEIMQMMNEAKSKPMNLIHDIAPRVSPFYHKSLTTLGKSCFTWMGTRPVVHVSEPTMIREVLANYKTYQKQRGGNPLTKLLVKGMIDAEGDQWVKHRKIINPAFHMEKLKHMIPAFYVSCNEMINKWEKALTQQNSCEVDVWPYLQTFSSDVISRTAFGSSFEEGRKIFELQREQAGLVMKAANSVYIPGSRFFPTKNNKRMKEIDQQVKGSIKSIINKRVVAMKAREASHDDLLGILLDSNYNEIKQHGNSKFGLSIEDVSIIFNEVLRLYSPAVLLRRLIHDETKLGNLTLPRGTLIQINALILHHDKDMWGEDANEFNPQRFYEGVSTVTKGQAAYLPFGGGPRICVGQNFAILEAKMALAMILQRFTFELSPSYSHAPYAIPTLQPQFGAHLILQKY
ncbi:hypothetical protein M8C21_033056 [Ambrosia artemisiifolia]|uniref:Cytochrome P450 n=1 Tax=Ambrosia artemisiifolia TaxID=4212 RepID=A0AAD5CI24_AMBAR|nr:hypothetical protein M8C21_033056 [Ambrosia artemisiifolia]